MTDGPEPQPTPAEETAAAPARTPPAEPDHEAARAMWDAYLAEHPDHPEYADDDPPSEYFGDYAALVDELLDLVLHGPKRATAGAVAEFRHAGEPRPRGGGPGIVHDSTGRPRAVVRSVARRIGPLDSVDAQFAWVEGEDDRTLESWLREHRRYFERTLPRIGVEFHDKLETVFERFRVVWPPEHADS